MNSNDSLNSTLHTTLKQFSENKELIKLTEEVCANIVDITNNENNKNNEDSINILNMYLLDDQGNNICDILNKINNNLSKIVNKIDSINP